MSDGPKAHDHAFRVVSHLDGCHYFSTSAACACGAQLIQRGERDLHDDPYAAVWMSDDAGHCERCRELLDGAAPTDFTSEVVMP